MACAVRRVRWFLVWTVFAGVLIAPSRAGAQSGRPLSDGERESMEGDLGERGQPYLEVQADGTLTVLPDPSLCPTANKVAYRFAGVSDDGAKGGAGRKEATSIHCANVDSAEVKIKVQLRQWNGAVVGEGCVTAAPDRHLTFSTQNTTIYVEDVILGGSAGEGTDSIFQGSGVVLIDRGTVVCSAQVLDPLGYPPIFAVNLPLWGACGYEADLVLENRASSGVERFTACRRVTARGMFSVEAGADVTFRSGGNIVLGDGFRVMSNATFVAAIDGSLPVE